MLPVDEYPQYLLTKVPEIPTLRDSLALEYLKANVDWCLWYCETTRAYEFADAMLKAREEEHEKTQT